MSVKEINSKKVTLLLSIAQGGYWSAFCAAYGFATVFLLSRGFSTIQIGMAIATSSILSVLMQPILATAADKAKRISIHGITISLIIVALITFGLLYFTKNIFLATLALFVLSNAIGQTLQPFLNAVSFYYINKGTDINYGLSRSMGSLAYAVVSTIIGKLVEKHGSDVIIAAGVIFFVVTAMVIIIMPKIKDDNKKVENSANRKMTGKSSGNIFSFFARYKLFSVALLGSTCIFIFHNSTNNYMLQMAESLGGGAVTIGIALAIAAAFEIPSMMFSYQLMKKIGYNYLIIIAGAFFCVKAVLYLMATNITMLYVSQTLQLVSYAFFMPASVFYVNYTMEENDKVKGQAIMTGTITLGSVIGSLIGGMLIGKHGIRSLEWTGLAFAIVGTILLFVAVSGVVKEKRG